MPRETQSFKKIVREHFFNTEWYNIYNLLEFIPNVYNNERHNESFYSICNKKLSIELSGYRFVDGRITPITSEE